MSRVHGSRDAARTLVRDAQRRDRLAAQRVRDAFPAVEQIQFDLSFGTESAPAPASQSHLLNPPAQAFFRFPCPHFDCDGEFDLHGPVAQLIGSSMHQSSGQLVCRGERAQHRDPALPCGTRLSYRIRVRLRTDSR